MQEYIGVDVIAVALGVPSANISMWLQRELPGMPQPDAVIRHRKQNNYAWLKSSLPAWHAWHGDFKARNAHYQVVKAQAQLTRALAALESEERGKP